MLSFIALYDHFNLRIIFFLPFNPLNAELNLICPLLTLFGAHHILHVSRERVNAIDFFSQTIIMHFGELAIVVQCDVTAVPGDT